MNAMIFHRGSLLAELELTIGPTFNVPPGKASGARKADWHKRLRKYSGVALAILTLGDDATARVITKHCASVGIKVSERFIWSSKRFLKQEELMQNRAEVLERIDLRFDFEEHADEQRNKIVEQMKRNTIH